MALDHMDTEDRESLITASLQQKFQNEHKLASAEYYYGQKRAAPSDTPVSDDEYKAECSVLPAGFLDKINIEKLLGDDFMGYYNNGLTCCPAVLPFADNLSDKAALNAGGRWREFLKNNDFFRLIVSSSGGFGQRFETDVPGYWHRLLPEILRKKVSEDGCTFVIDYPYPPRPGATDPGQAEENRKWLVSQISAAIGNLHRFFGSNFGSGPDSKPD